MVRTFLPFTILPFTILPFTILPFTILPFTILPFTILPLTILLALPLAAADGASNIVPHVVPNIVPHVETHDFGGGTLRIHAGAGGLSIVHGADNQHVTVRYTAIKDDRDASSRVKLSFKSQGSDTSIDLRAPWNVRLDTVIEVPNPLSLEIRMKDGDLLIQGVEGNKTLQSRSGDITLTQPKDEYAQAYKQIAVSAKIGSVYGPEFQTTIQVPQARQDGGAKREAEHTRCTPTSRSATSNSCPCCSWAGC